MERESAVTGVDVEVGEGIGVVVGVGAGVRAGVAVERGMGVDIAPPQEANIRATRASNRARFTSPFYLPPPPLL